MTRRRAVVVLLAVTTLFVLAVLYGGIRDAVNPTLADFQGCPNYIGGLTFAFDDGCPPDVHPWLLP